MRMIKVMRSMSWFFLSMICIIIMAYCLSLINLSHHNNFYSEVIVKHYYIWFMLRLGISGIFFCVWPSLVRHWAKKYQWDEKHKNFVIKQRLRYLIWFFIMNIVICIF